MKRFAILIGLAFELVVCGCGNNRPSTVTNTATNGNWEAQLIDGTGQAALLNFVITFSVTNSGPLDITGFGFFNQGSCFTTGLNQQNVSGSASLATSTTTGQVTGTLNLTIKSKTNASVLTLTTGPNGLTGTSNGTTSTTGTLSNGVAVGTWNLASGSSSSSGCTGTGTFIMCQGAATCSTSPADRLAFPTNEL